MEQALKYKKQIASRLMPVEGKKAIEEIIESDEYYISEKLDGHIGFAKVENNKVEFYNRSGTLLNLPGLASEFPKIDGIWAGELYLSGDRSRSYQVASAVANDSPELKFAVFDSIDNLDKAIFERLEIVKSKIKVTDRVHPIEFKVVESRKDIFENYQEIIERGGEGLIVYDAMNVGYKLKPIQEIDVCVLGYSMKEDGTAIRSILVGVFDGEYWRVIASVGGGFDDEARKMWLEKLIVLETENDIVLVAKNNIAYKWVKPEIVVQIKCLDIITEDSKGIIEKNYFKFDENLGYQSQGKVYGVSLISPVFMHERTDKKPNLDDTGINQIIDRIEYIDQKSSTLKLEKSSIIHREVYTKNSKTGTMIRKFIGIKTNKEETKNYPAYYFFYTDYSAGRKEPLSTEIKICSSEEKLHEIILLSKESNVKTGWQLTV